MSARNDRSSRAFQKGSRDQIRSRNACLSVVRAEPTSSTLGSTSPIPCRLQQEIAYFDQKSRRRSALGTPFQCHWLAVPVRNVCLLINRSIWWILAAARCWPKTPKLIWRIKSKRQPQPRKPCVRYVTVSNRDVNCISLAVFPFWPDLLQSEQFLKILVPRLKLGPQNQSQLFSLNNFIGHFQKCFFIRTILRVNVHQNSVDGIDHELVTSVFGVIHQCSQDVKLSLLIEKIIFFYLRYAPIWFCMQVCFRASVSAEQLLKQLLRHMVTKQTDDVIIYLKKDNWLIHIKLT